jgi:uncharacterized repeat protein (TIGR01451 family)
MKKTVLITFLVILSNLNFGYTQITEISLTDSINTCTNSYISLCFSVGQNDDINPLITVDWGDQTNTIINDQTFSGNDNPCFQLSHDYPDVGQYSIQVTVISSVNAEIIETDPILISYFGYGNCGRINPWVIQNVNCGVNGNSEYNAIYDLIKQNGEVITFTGSIEGLNIYDTPYTLKLNDYWLIQNNLSQINNSFVIEEFNPNFGTPGNLLSFYVETLNNIFEPDYKITKGYSVGFSPMELVNLWLNFENISCSQTGMVNVLIDYPAFLVPFTEELINPIINGNTLSFYLDLQNSYYSSDLTFFMPGTIQAGTELNFFTSITDVSGAELNTINNAINFTGIVYNSYDPNQKTVNRGQNINPNQQEELIYTIDFQNEGNYPALNVRLLDTLSSNLDLSTFRVLNQKHNVVTNLNANTGILEFKFPNINLAPKEQDEEGSKGFVTYAIKEKANLPINSEIENTAYIYFDFNPAIITNTTYNINSLLNVSELQNDHFHIYPNPTQNNLHIESKSSFNELILMDLNGKIILQQKSDFKGVLNLSAVENGVYYLHLRNENSNSIQKIIINK